MMECRFSVANAECGLQSVQNICTVRVMAYDPITERAIRAAGGPTALAKRLGVVPSAVTQWTKVPPRWVHKVADLSGIPPEELRPDMFEALSAAPPAAQAAA
jgi:DNA-binding transcriptional regulator YdaS (Cro superfamily)